jgi:hypothetical protein
MDNYIDQITKAVKIKDYETAIFIAKNIMNKPLTNEHITKLEQSNLNVPSIDQINSLFKNKELSEEETVFIEKYLRSQNSIKNKKLIMDFLKDKKIEFYLKNQIKKYENELINN